MKTNLLLPLFEPMVSTVGFFTGLNKLDVIKIKLPSEAELKSITEGNKIMYNERIEVKTQKKLTKLLMLLTKVFIILSKMMIWMMKMIELIII